MKKILFATTVAAFLIPAASFAQTTTTATDTPMATDAPMTTDSDTTGSTTTDLTGNYTIVNNLASINSTNSKTDMSQVQATIDANPGLAEALANNGIKTSEIGAIQIKPNGQVEVFGKGS